MIVDCFPFFDELDLLEVRLNELKDLVDVFVVTESPYTFTSRCKPLYLKDNMERFKGFNIHYTLYEPTIDVGPMQYETAQKQFNLDQAFFHLKEGDILAHGDVDEIPRASVLERALFDEWEAARLNLDLFYYYMNYKNKRKMRFKNTRLVRFKEPFNHITSQKFPYDKEYWDAGWHFSFLGDIENKIAAWGHAPEYNKAPFNTIEHIEKCKEEGSDLFMRRGSRNVSFEHIKEDFSYLPKYVLDNMPKFEKYFKR